MAMPMISQSHLQVARSPSGKTEVGQACLQVMVLAEGRAKIARGCLQVLKVNSAALFQYVNTWPGSITVVGLTPTIFIGTYAQPAAGEVALSSTEPGVSLITPTAVLSITPAAHAVEIIGAVPRAKVAREFPAETFASVGWDLVKNAGCKTQKQRIKAVFCHVGTETKAVIDEEGRLYVWGFNYVPWAAGFPDYRIEGLQWQSILLPTIPPTTKGKKWVFVECGEYHIFALDSKGKLYATGLSYNEMFGFPTNPADKYEDKTLPGFTPLFPELSFKAITGMWYSVQAIDTEGRLWSWGKNFDGEAGLGSYDPVSVPTLNPFFTEKVKCVAADIYHSAVVTESDRIYTCGSVSEWIVTDPNRTDYDWYEITEFVDRPEGASIVDCRIGYESIIVLFDNGELFAARVSPNNYGFEEYSNDDPIHRVLRKLPWWGYAVANGSPTWPDYDVVIVPAPKIVKILNMENWASFSVLDEAGNIWTGGTEQYSTGNAFEVGRAIRYSPPGYYPGSYVYIMTLSMGAKWPGETQWQALSFTGYYGAAMAIDRAGWLYVWGSNSVDELGLGYPQTAGARYLLLPARTPEGVNTAYVWSPDLEYAENERTGLNYDAINLSPYKSPIASGPEHDPCGHWHLRASGDDGAGAASYGNCWVMSLDITDDNKLFVATRGRWLPFPIIFWEYDVNTNRWTELYVESQPLYSSGFPGESDWWGGTQAFYNGVAEYDPFWFSPHISNSRMGLWVRKEGVVNFYSLGGTFADGKHRMAITTSEAIIIAGEFSGNIEWRISRNGGISWGLLWSVSASLVADYKVNVVKVNNRISLTYLGVNGTVYQNYSTNDGDTWSSVSKASGMALPVSRYNFVTSGLSAILSIVNSLGQVATFYHASSIAISGFLTAPFTVSDSSSLALIQGTRVQLNEEVATVSGEGQFSNATEEDVVLPKAATLGDMTTFDYNQTGTIAFSDWAFVSVIGGEEKVAILISDNLGKTWNVREMPLNFILDENDKLHDVMFEAPAFPSWKLVGPYRSWGYKMPPEKKGSNKRSCDH